LLSVQTLIWVAVAYLATYIFTDAVVMPVQELYGPSLAPGISILFLPHGVHVIATWLLRWQSVVAILPGNVIIFYVLYADHPDLSLLEILAGIAFTTVSIPATFEVLSRIGMRPLFASSGPPRFTSVLIGGTLAGVANAAFFTMFLEAGRLTFLGVIVGDTMGLILLLVLLLCVFRFILDKARR